MTEIRALPERLASDPDSIARDLFRLVLTVVELLRQLLERQAIRRIDAGGLGDDQVESLGLALLRLHDAVEELRTQYGITPEDLNIDLGPLGTLLSPTDD